METDDVLMSDVQEFIDALMESVVDLEVNDEDYINASRKRKGSTPPVEHHSDFKRRNINVLLGSSQLPWFFLKFLQLLKFVFYVVLLNMLLNFVLLKVIKICQQKICVWGFYHIFNI